MWNLWPCRSCVLSQRTSHACSFVVRSHLKRTHTHTHTAETHHVDVPVPTQAAVISAPQDSDRLSLTSRKGRVTFLVSNILQSPCCILHKITTGVGSLIPWAQAMLIEPSAFFRQHFALGWRAGRGQHFLWDGGTSSSVFRPQLLWDLSMIFPFCMGQGGAAASSGDNSDFSSSVKK